jgi:hypothetical protein
MLRYTNAPKRLRPYGIVGASTYLALGLRFLKYSTTQHSIGVENGTLMDGMELCRYG